MPNRFRSVRVSPSTVKSGRTVSVAVGYESAEKRSILISASPSFRVTPTSVPCAADPSGAVEFEVTVTRTKDQSPANCTLLFQFFADERRRVVEVT
jgi:hypothetical protein